MGVYRAVLTILCGGALLIGCATPATVDEVLPDPCALLSDVDAELIVGPSFWVHGPDGRIGDRRDAVCRRLDPNAVGPAGPELVVSVARPDDACATVDDRLAQGAQPTAAQGRDGYLLDLRAEYYAEAGGCADGYLVTLRLVAPGTPRIATSLAGLLPLALAALPGAPTLDGVPAPAPDRFATAPDDVCALVDPVLVAELTGVDAPLVPRPSGCEIDGIAGPTVTLLWVPPFGDRSGSEVLDLVDRVAPSAFGSAQVRVDNVLVTVSGGVLDDTAGRLARSVADRLGAS